MSENAQAANGEVTQVPPVPTPDAQPTTDLLPPSAEEVLAVVYAEARRLSGDTSFAPNERIKGFNDAMNNRWAVPVTATEVSELPKGAEKHGNLVVRRAPSDKNLFILGIFGGEVEGGAALYRVFCSPAARTAAFTIITMHGKEKSEREVAAPVFITQMAQELLPEEEEEEETDEVEEDLAYARQSLEACTDDLKLLKGAQGASTPEQRARLGQAVNLASEMWEEALDEYIQAAEAYLEGDDEEEEEPTPPAPGATSAAS